jgi:hypothetical protein
VLVLASRVLQEDGAGGGKAVDQKVISLKDKVQVVERDSEELSNHLVEELLDLIQKAEKQEEPNNRSKATYWVYRVPFAGIRYYSYQ